MLRLLTLALLVMCLGCGDSSRPKVRVAVTTSTQNSGLIDQLEPAFEKRFELDLEVLAVGSGRALELGRRGDVDVIWVHDRAAEDTFLSEGHGIERRDVMWNEFLLVGPEQDPAGVQGLKDARAALQKIHESRALFISRGDDSGTHRRELTLRNQSSPPIPSESTDSYVIAGLGQGKTLLLANQREAYTLTDEGTWLAFRSKLDLKEVVRDEKALRNPYGALLVNPERHPHVAAEAARNFLDFITSKEGRQIIDSLQVNGEQLFHSFEQGS